MQDIIQITLTILKNTNKYNIKIRIRKKKLIVKQINTDQTEIRTKMSYVIKYKQKCNII